MKIITNNQYRELFHYFDLPGQWQKVASKEYDYNGKAYENDQYFIFRNQLYSLINFVVTMKTAWTDYPELLAANWHAIDATSHYRPLVLRLSDCNEIVLVGTYMGE